jgi:hypothetical protein
VVTNESFLFFFSFPFVCVLFISNQVVFQSWQTRAIDAENLCADREAKLAKLADLVKKKRAEAEQSGSIAEEQMRLRVQKQQSKIDRLEEQIAALEFLAHQQQVALATVAPNQQAAKAKSKWDS